MKSIFKYIFIGAVLVVLFQGCLSDVKQDLALVMSLAKENRNELEKAIDHYKRVKPDPEKLEALEYLIANMLYQESLVSEEPLIIPSLDSLVNAADSLIYAEFVRAKKEGLPDDDFQHNIQQIKSEFSKTAALSSSDSTFSHSFQTLPDYKIWTAQRLVEHVDNIFQIREKAGLLLRDKDLFYGYVLPYKAISKYYHIEEIADYRRLFDKYLSDIPVDSLRAKIKRYNLIVRSMRGFLKSYPFKQSLGMKELFFNPHGVDGCIEMAHQATLALRSSGVPIAVDFYASHKAFNGRHYYCSSPEELSEGWFVYSPESAVPNPQDSSLNNVMNMYRIEFSHQKSHPFFKANKDEVAIAPNLSSPFIRDVTDCYKTAEKTKRLSIAVKHENRPTGIVYLASFVSQKEDGMVPVTWGQYNRLTGQASFEKVIPERFYFPVVSTDRGVLKTFGPPFYFTKKGDVVYYNDRSSRDSVITTLTRKFPVRKRLLEQAATLKGSVILATNDGDFENSDTVGRIDFVPIFDFQDIPLNMRNGPYKNYRIKIPKKAYISEVQYLTYGKYGYEYTQEPSSLNLHPSSNSNVVLQDDYVSLLDRPWEEARKHAIWDGNPQTGLSKYGTVNFSMQNPVFIHAIRMMPIHDDNNITAGDDYQLLTFEEGKWRSVNEFNASGSWIKLKLVGDKLYWLKNLTKGREEMPLHVDMDGKVKFIYTDL